MKKKKRGNYLDSQETVYGVCHQCFSNVHIRGIRTAHVHVDKQNKKIMVHKTAHPWEACTDFILLGSFMLKLWQGDRQTDRETRPFIICIDGKSLMVAA